MLEILLLFFLSRHICQLAIKKGLPPGKWKLSMILIWIGFELFGLMAGIQFFGAGNLYGLMLFAIICGFGGYLTIRYILENKPDIKSGEDENKIRTDQLRP